MLDVAVVCVLVGGADSDDALRTRHLELQVGIVGDRHELGITGSTDDSIVGAMKPNHLKSEDLLHEVRGCAEVDREVDAADGEGFLPGHDSMEAPCARLELRPLDS